MRLARGLILVAGSVVFLAAFGRGDPPPKGEKPDLIVSDLRLDGDVVILEVQNQGPGTAKKETTVEATVTGWVETTLKDDATGKEVIAYEPVSITVKVPVPVEVLATDTVKIPLKKFEVKDFTKFQPSLHVTLDTKGDLDEERKTNNTFHRELDFTGKAVPPDRGDYKAGIELPDLVVTDITHDDINLFVHYANKGKGATGADFLVSIKSGEKKFDGNSYYRFPVPAPGTETKTGGFNLTLLDLKSGDEVEVEATIDHEDRVRETDKKNNTFKKKLTIR
jgi:hypothetical protein